MAFSLPLMPSSSTTTAASSRRLMAMLFFAIVSASLFFLSFTFVSSSGRHKLFSSRACDEIYVVGEGETLHTISEKCGDPFIVERNPHIQDPDDVFPGLVIKITPATSISGKH